MESYPLAEPQDEYLAITVIRPTARQQRRLIRYLLKNQGASTVQVNRYNSIANVSDTASKANECLFSIGLYIFCKRPPTPFLNKFQEESDMHQWYCAKIPSHLMAEHNRRHKVDTPDIKKAATG